MSDRQQALRALPSVDSVLADPQVEALAKNWGISCVTSAARAAIETARAAILKGDAPTQWDWPAQIVKLICSDQEPTMRHVVNLSGVVSHTNLGRARLAEEAVVAAASAGASNVNLEYSLKSGGRGERDSLVEELVMRLTGAEAATVVNNNAAAVLLALNTLSFGKRTIVSRGELIEIGGSFRLPEIMEKSGCHLAEVGTTNRTHLADYEKAIDPDTALALRAHTSNFKVVGFTTKPKLSDLAALCHERGIPLMDDLGSGALIDLAQLGLPSEPTVADTIAQGADVVTFSGDKLLGGPQAGLIVGRREYIDRIRKNPLKRALRPDKMILAALEATLRLYLCPEVAIQHIPTLRHLSRPVAQVRDMAERAAAIARGYFKEEAEVTIIDDICRAGSGALPEVDIPSVSVAIRHAKMSPNQLAAWFRERKTPVIGRVERDLFRLDMRTMDDPDRELDTGGWRD
ncbi:MAG: L-seryl-tRNA(Sec) selenium transferase [Nitrospinota bacterium]|nr:L-seryl-tRNA(Sec) selenium transferase [Nitrospinota bacterium]MDH5756199.1 L-seryl-tRNA(Sec) selenium transferase [Nitrospinota bacterium]